MNKTLKPLLSFFIIKGKRANNSFLSKALFGFVKALGVYFDSNGESVDKASGIGD